MIDTATVPLSVMGSYISVTTSQRGIAVNSLHGNARFNQQSMHIRLGDAPLVVVSRRADQLVVESGTVSATVSFLSPQVLAISGVPKGTAVTIDLMPQLNYEYSNVLTDETYGDTVLVNFAKNLAKYLVYAVDAPLTFAQATAYDPAGGDAPATGSALIHLVTQSDNAVIYVQEVPHFAARPAPHQAPPTGYTPFADFVAPWLQRADAGSLATIQAAAMILWSNVVAPQNQLHDWTLYSSNKRFAGMWSWDHAIGALALAPAHPALATACLRSIYSAQAPNGQVPDMLTDTTSNWNFSKPPIQPLIYQAMTAYGVVADATLASAFKQHVQFYLTEMADADGWAAYYHGNDSGQDNSTVFAAKTAVVAPDLNAYLIADMFVLADLFPDEGWEARATARLAAFTETFWRDAKMRARQRNDHQLIDSQALLPLMAIVLGHRLPSAVQAGVVAQLAAPNRLTAYGLATEAVDSPDYLADGYWRGPVWAPTTVLAYLGLKDAGKEAMAMQLATRWCRLCEQHGFYECFDAQTGTGLRDTGFMWSAAAYLFFKQILTDN